MGFAISLRFLYFQLRVSGETGLYRTASTAKRLRAANSPEIPPCLGAGVEEKNRGLQTDCGAAHTRPGFSDLIFWNSTSRFHTENSLQVAGDFDDCIDRIGCWQWIEAA
jgi:hypothetical protein